RRTATTRSSNARCRASIRAKPSIRARSRSPASAANSSPRPRTRFPRCSFPTRPTNATRWNDAGDCRPQSSLFSCGGPTVAIDGDIADAQCPDLGVWVLVDEHLGGVQPLVGDGEVARLDINAENAADVAVINERPDCRFVKLRAAAHEFFHAVA